MRAAEKDAPDIEGRLLEAELFRRTQAGTWQYRIRGDGVSGDLYMEADDDSQPPRRLELMMRPKGDDKA